jgi:hypothetical protein
MGWGRVRDHQPAAEVPAPPDRQVGLILDKLGPLLIQGKGMDRVPVPPLVLRLVVPHKGQPAVVEHPEVHLVLLKAVRMGSGSLLPGLGALRGQMMSGSQ